MTAKARTKTEDKDDLTLFEKGLKAMGDSDWKGAVEILQPLAESADRRSLRLRAQQYVQMAREQLEDEEVEIDDPFLKAVVERNRGNLEEALKLCREQKRHQKDERFAYLAAALLCLREKTDEAAEQLRKAIELNPKNRVHAYHDSDFKELRTHSDHAELFRVE